MEKIPGVADAHIQQVLNYPGLQDQCRPPARRRSGLSPARRRQQHADRLSSSVGRVAVLLPQSAVNGVNYFVAVQMPLPQISTGRPTDEHADGARPQRSANPCPRAAGRADHAAVRHRHGRAAIRHGIGQPLHRAAGDRCRRQCRRPRPGRGRRRHPDGDQRDQPGPAGHHAHRHPRPERGDEHRLHRPGRGPDPGGDPGLCAAGDPVPVLGRSADHHDGGAGRADRHSLDAGADRHHHQCGIADGRDHVGRHFGIELDPGGQLRQRPARAPGTLGAGGGDRGRPHPAAARS